MTSGEFLNLLIVNGFDSQTKVEKAEFSVVDNAISCVVQVSFYSDGDFVPATGVFDASTVLRKVVANFANVDADKVSMHNPGKAIYEMINLTNPNQSEPNHHA